MRQPRARGGLLFALLAACAPPDAAPRLPSTGNSVRVTLEMSGASARLVDALLSDRVVAATPGDLLVVGASGAVLATGAVPPPQSRSVLLPGGAGGVGDGPNHVTVELPWPAGAVAVELDGVRIVNPARTQPEGKADSLAGAIAIHQSGPPASRLNLVMVGDGYDATEQDKLVTDAQKFAQHVLAFEPYRSYTSLLNIWAVPSVSNHSEVGHGGKGEDTSYGCYFDCASLHRLVCCDGRKVTHAAGSEAQGVLVLINVHDPLDSANYGGSGGGSYATATTNDSGMDIALHEIGHSLAGLLDEYKYGQAAPAFAVKVKPNCAADANQTPWEAWKQEPGVGAFPGCQYDSYFRPTDSSCIMNTLGGPYCPVCREQVVLALYRHLPRMIEVATPDPRSTIELFTGQRFDVRIQPLGQDAGLLDITWTLNGTVVQQGGPVFSLDGCNAQPGKLAVAVHDPIAWVKQDPDNRLSDHMEWKVSTNSCP